MSSTTTSPWHACRGARRAAAIVLPATTRSHQRSNIGNGSIPPTACPRSAACHHARTQLKRGLKVPGLTGFCGSAEPRARLALLVPRAPGQNARTASTAPRNPGHPRLDGTQESRRRRSEAPRPLARGWEPCLRAPFLDLDFRLDVIHGGRWPQRNRRRRRLTAIRSVRAPGTPARSPLPPAASASMA